MKQKSIAMIVHDALFAAAKSPGPNGKPIKRLMHLKRLKRNGVETGSIQCVYQYVDKWGSTKPETTIFTMNRLGHIKFDGTSPDRRDLLGDRLGILNTIIQAELDKERPDIRFSFGTYECYVGIWKDRGKEPTAAVKKDILEKILARDYGYQYNWINRSSYEFRDDPQRGKPRTNAEVWEKFGMHTYFNEYRWERILNERYMNEYYDTPVQVTLRPSSTSESGYVAIVNEAVVKVPPYIGSLHPIKKARRYFKVMTAEGRTGYAGFQWDMPKSNNGGDTIPGDWHDLEGKTLHMCNTGIHVCTPEMLHHWTNRGDQNYIVEMETRGPIYASSGTDNKLLVRKARVKRVIAPVFGDEFDAACQGIGRHRVIAMLARGGKLPKVFQCTVELTVQTTMTHTFSSTKRSELKDKVNTIVANESQGNNKVVKKKVTYVKH